MSRFIIQPHFRLQEWVAEEKGYFKAEGLEYEFREEVQSTDGKVHDRGDKVGAYQTFEAGRTPTKDHSHEDAYVAVRDAFDGMQRQVSEHVRSVRDGGKRAVLSRDEDAA